MIEPLFLKLQHTYYDESAETKPTAAQIQTMVQEMEEICMENGLSDSHQSINWAKVFLSIKNFSEGRKDQALELLEMTRDNYLKTLDGD